MLKNLFFIGLLTILTPFCALAMEAGCGHGGDSEQGSIQSQIDKILAEDPEAEQISENEVAWEDGSIILTFGNEKIENRQENWIGASSSCPKGYFCFFDKPRFDNLNGAKWIRFSNCSKSKKSLGIVRNKVSSWLNNHPSKAIKVYNDDSPTPYVLWNELPLSRNENVNIGNNMADSFKCAN